MAVRLTLLAVLLLAGCEAYRDDKLFRHDGLYYAPRLSSTNSDPAAFSVRVTGFEQGLEGAREAARYEATKHCINYIGSSDAIWQVGPDSPKEELIIEDRALVFAGRCRT